MSPAHLLPPPIQLPGCTASLTGLFWELKIQNNSYVWYIICLCLKTHACCMQSCHIRNVSNYHFKMYREPFTPSTSTFNFTWGHLVWPSKQFLRFIYYLSFVPLCAWMYKAYATELQYSSTNKSIYFQCWL